MKVNVPLRFRKVARVWCGGARETHWATCHNEVSLSKTKEFLKSPYFSDLNGMKKQFYEWHIHLGTVKKVNLILAPYVIQKIQIQIFQSIREGLFRDFPFIFDHPILKIKPWRVARFAQMWLLVALHYFLRWNLVLEILSKVYWK